ncbi:MAG: twin-arginine translocation signal domain-containing protein, partial [Anaerolineae bacterium]
MSQQRLSRRGFLGRSLLAAAGAALAGCAQPQVIKETVKETVEVQVEKVVTPT